LNISGKLFKDKDKLREVILYLVFGVLTTVVNYIFYGIFLYVFGVTGEAKKDLLVIVANTIAWVAAVLFAFATNKFYVFGSKSKEKKTVAREFSSFVAARLLTLGVEDGIIYLGALTYKWAEITLGYTIWTWGVKIAASVVVVILNYIFSKLFIFKKRDENPVKTESDIGNGD